MYSALALWLCTITSVISISTVWGSGNCTAHPSLWCRNDEIDAACSVTDQCKAYKSYYRNKPVMVSLLYESMSPPSYHYIKHTLKPFYEKYVKSLAFVEIVPWGNAKRDSNGTIICEHGSRECDFNKMEGCSLIVLPLYSKTKKLGFDMIECMEDEAMQSTATAEASVRVCGRKLGLIEDIVDALMECYTTELGEQLQQSAERFTNGVWPEKHGTLPWIMFNEISMQMLQSNKDDLLGTVCEWFVSSETPAGCTTPKRNSAARQLAPIF